MRFRHVYSPEQFARAAAAWSALLAIDRVTVSSDLGWPISGGPTVETVWELIWSDGEQTHNVHSYTVALFSFSDYGGTCADVANARFLAADDSPFHDWVVLSEDGAHGQGAATVRLGELPGDHIDTGLDLLEQLVATMGAAEAEGLLCRRTHDTYVAELAAAAWDQWLRCDIPHELADLINTHQVPIPRVLLDHGHPVETARDYADWLWQQQEQRFAEAYYAYPGNQWACADWSPTTVLNHAHHPALRHAAHLAFGWRLDPTPPTSTPPPLLPAPVSGDARHQEPDDRHPEWSRTS